MSTTIRTALERVERAEARYAAAGEVYRDALADLEARIGEAKRETAPVAPKAKRNGAERRKRGELTAAILAALPAFESDVVEKVGGNPGSVRNAIARLVAKGELRLDGRGRLSQPIREEAEGFA